MRETPTLRLFLYDGIVAAGGNVVLKSTHYIAADRHVGRKSHNFDVEYIYGFVGWGSACKVDDVTALPSHIQDGGYALLWQGYDNNKMAAICSSTSSTVQS